MEAPNKQVYQLKGFMRGDESGEMYTNNFEGEFAEQAAEKWLIEMDGSFELFKKGWAFIKNEPFQIIE